MKFLRVGEFGKETPAVLDNENKIRDLSKIIKDFNSENLNFEILDKIKKTELESLPQLDNNQRIGACVTKPSNFFAIGLNYKAHAEGTNSKLPTEPILFNKSSGCIQGPNDPILKPQTEASFDDPESHIGVAKKLNKEIPNSHILDQYANPSNPEAHYNGTAEEIIEDFGTNLDMVVIGVGTGGTITGIAKRLKEHIPNIKVIGADPIGSILGGGTEVKSYLVEGIGYDFFPDVLDNSMVDEYVKTKDEESFLMARRLIKEEGLLCGGSSGTATVAALKSAHILKEDQKCLILLPDGIRNYMTKFPNDKWMESKGFKI